MNRKKFAIGFVLSVLIILASSMMTAAQTPLASPSPTLLATLPEGAYGSTIGPDGALYVTEPALGRIWRVDPRSGDAALFASDLPTSALPFGGVVDVAFLGPRAYALVTLVGSDVGGNDIVGIYRVTGPNSSTVVADIGEFSINNPPVFDFEYVVPTGVQYALESFRGGFLVTDGHLNRVLWASRHGLIAEMIAFDNNVPTGLDTRRDRVYMAEAGPIPHPPEVGKVVSFQPNSSTAMEIASGAPLLVDVEFGPGYRLYALSQGDFPQDGEPAETALPDTGSLREVQIDGTLSVVVDALDRPTSMEFIDNAAYIVTLEGEIWKVDNVSPPRGGYP